LYAKLCRESFGFPNIQSLRTDRPKLIYYFTSFLLKRLKKQTEMLNFRESVTLIGRTVSLVIGAPQIRGALLGKMLCQKGITQTIFLKLLFSPSKTLYCPG
jgi:hypothetical protein